MATKTRTRQAPAQATPAPEATPEVPVSRGTEPAVDGTGPVVTLNADGWPADLGSPVLGPRNHKPKAAPKLQVSASQLRALQRLAAQENGGLTRSDLHADPMVVVALAKKALVTVNREGDERAVDWIEITEAGRQQAV